MINKPMQKMVTLIMFSTMQLITFTGYAEEEDPPQKVVIIGHKDHNDDDDGGIGLTLPGIPSLGGRAGGPPSPPPPTTIDASCGSGVAEGDPPLLKASVAANLIWNKVKFNGAYVGAIFKFIWTDGSSDSFQITTVKMTTLGFNTPIAHEEAGSEKGNCTK